LAGQLNCKAIKTTTIILGGNRMKQGIIVGASSGIGWELAVQLAAQGYQLGLMARRDGCLNKLADSLPGEHFVQKTDVANAEQAVTELTSLIEKMGEVELIVVNSGVGSSERLLDWEVQRQMIDVNVRGFACYVADGNELFCRARRWSSGGRILCCGAFFWRLNSHLQCHQGLCLQLPQWIAVASGPFKEANCGDYGRARLCGYAHG
jgi:NAD(P)-dependent dehydrogenase (short-subunit alcohol dehydrogenase family)